MTDRESERMRQNLLMVLILFSLAMAALGLWIRSDPVALAGFILMAGSAYILGDAGGEGSDT